MTNAGRATRLPRYRRASTPPPMQLTARDIRVVRAVHEMRFLTKEQVQQLEFSPSTASYCKRRLSLLYHHGFLDRKFIPAPNSLGSTRALYCLTRQGARLLAHEMKQELAELGWRPSDSKRELYFMEHTLATNDFRIRLLLAAKQHGLAVAWTDERALRRREAKDYVEDPKRHGRKLAIVPDGYFTLARDGQTSAFALEIDRATVEEKPFKEKIRAYGEWKMTGAYERRYGTKSLRVLWVVADVSRDADRLQRIKRWAQAEGGRSLFWFAPLVKLTPSTILNGPAWLKAGAEGSYPLLA